MQINLFHYLRQKIPQALKKWSKVKLPLKQGDGNDEPWKP